MNLIVAVDKKWAIGKGGSLLTYLPEDLKYFKEKTYNNVIIIGRKTLESFPNGEPLKGRVNIVLTSNREYKKDNAIAVNSISKLLDLVKEYKDKEVFVSGGGEVYRELLPYCDTAYITHLDNDFNGDTFIPIISNETGWSLVSESKREYKGLGYSFSIYKRIK